MNGRQLPIWGTVKAAFELAFRSVLQFPVTAACVAIVLYAVNPPGLLRALTGGAPSIYLSAASNLIVEAIVFAPFALLVHRFIVLGERAESQGVARGEGRALRFVAALILVKLVQYMWIFASGRDDVWWVWLILASLVVSLIAGVRVCLAFPAIATDASPTPFRDSLRYTRGSTCQIFLVFALIFVIWAPLIFAFDWTRNMTIWSNSVVLHIAHRVVWHAVSAFMPVIYVAVASHLWKTRADWSASEAPAGLSRPIELGTA